MMYTLPKEVTINGSSYPVRRDGDFRLILEVISYLTSAINSNPFTGQTEINEENLFTGICLFFEGFDGIEDITANFHDLGEVLSAIYDFINCGQKDSEKSQNQLKLIDWEKDEQLIVSAVNNVAKTEIRALPYVHWWTFVSYYMAIGECSLAHIVSIRKKIATGKKLEKHEKEFKRENPEYFTERISADYEKQMQEVIDMYTVRKRDKKKGGD